MTWTITHGRIDEQMVPGKRLGLDYKLDSRSAAYPFRAAPGLTLANQLWPRHTGILNQGDVGSCTGNAEAGCLGTSPFFETLQPGAVLDETEALALYSAAETIDGDGPYPPQDNGSSGQSVCQAALNAGLISGYTHAADVNAMAAALQSGPVIVGVSWYDSFDTPDSSGYIKISPGAQVRGGHEVLVRGVDVAGKLFRADNSWGTSWGLAGGMTFSWGTMTRLFGEQGDCTVSVPLSQPAPVPVPVPVPPGPVPPGPSPDDVFASDPRMLAWAKARHTGSNSYAARKYAAWRSARAGRPRP